MLTTDNLYDRQKETREMFNRIAKTYDPLNRGLSFGIDSLWRKKAISHMEIAENSIILDVATGTGDLAFLALKKNAARVIGIDPAYEMIRKTNEKLTAYSKKFFAIESFGEYLPLAEDYFTHIMISYGIRNITDRPLALKEFYRVLRPGGRFAILEFSKTILPLAQTFYNIYFRYILTKIGGWVSGDRKAYEYFHDSVSRFPAKEEFIKECIDAGFGIISVKSMSFGVCTFYLFQK
ncbi:MAG: bifunctional demethylmenaquinone methyltransferase/2-methoxy-6-polyprenyl-1,4-benzoquinol methylase UbiE [Spirochaetia bacterium]|nr:bifunctional demethylmenaquinone methyltransferase/2-methoxy-6-polyprenyl-1,4-benzoquinol methylase UbiE [Spirochaetia bacterium]